MKTKNKYFFPIDLSKITATLKDPLSHVDNLVWAVDFDAPEGLPILAAADGVVVEVKDNSNRGGLDKSFENDGNYIEILHDHNEISEYEHLKFSSALVKVGDRVRTGEVIARVGDTGWSKCSHLHFMVYQKDTDYKTLEIPWQNKILVVCNYGKNRSKFLAEYLSRKGYETDFGGLQENLLQAKINWAEVVISVHEEIKKELLVNFDLTGKCLIELNTDDRPAEKLDGAEWTDFQNNLVYPKLIEQVDKYLP
ncbi:MAG: M23 family metallopeptidase [Candidatus Uhrbacteria bacterium]